MLGEQIFQYYLCLLNFGRVILVFDHQPNLAILEAIEDVTGRDRA
jgi:hypothetical protein